MTNAPITLIPIHPVAQGAVEILVHPLVRIFNTKVSIDTSSSLLADFAYNAMRGQYNSTTILLKLSHLFSQHEGKILGVTSVDLCIPVLTFVFGEAQLQGKFSVMSTARLTESFYGLEENLELFTMRVIKEATHELGHTYGLVHCRDLNCTMHSSTSVEEVDIKGSNLCRSCMEKILS